MATVLVVDDDKDIRESLVEILRDEGYEVTSACNGAEALEAIDRRAPDVMLLDLMMPVVNGWEVLETLRLRGTHPKLPVVILSALEAQGLRRLHPEADPLTEAPRVDRYAPRPRGRVVLDARSGDHATGQSTGLSDVSATGCNQDF